MTDTLEKSVTLQPTARAIVDGALIGVDRIDHVVQLGPVDTRPGFSAMFSTLARQSFQPSRIHVHPKIANDFEIEGLTIQGVAQFALAHPFPASLLVPDHSLVLNFDSCLAIEELFIRFRNTSDHPSQFLAVLIGKPLSPIQALVELSRKRAAR